MIFQCWSHPLHETSSSPLSLQGLYQVQRVSAHFCASNMQPNRWCSTETLVSTGHSVGMRDVPVTSGKTALPSSCCLWQTSPGQTHLQAETQISWLSVQNLYTTNTTSPHWRGSRATRPAKWQSHNANMASADSPTIGEAATWANTNMFARFYQLDPVTNSNTEFGRRVLMLAGSSNPALFQWGGCRISQKQHFRR